MKEKLSKYINKELKQMDRGIVATPKSRESLESFAGANIHDILLMQMSINFGYKMALENINNELNN